MTKSARVSFCLARCQDCDFELHSSNGQALAAHHTLRYHHTVVWQIILDDIGEDCTEAGIEDAEALLGMLGVSVDLKTHFHALKKENAS